MKDEPAEAAPKPIPSVARDASYLTRSASPKSAIGRRPGVRRATFTEPASEIFHKSGPESEEVVIYSGDWRIDPVTQTMPILACRAAPWPPSGRACRSLR